MAGTNAVAAKKALYDTLAAALASPVVVLYAYDGKQDQRELVYLGKATGPQNLFAMRGNARAMRQEDLTITLVVEVTKPGATPYDVEVRAQQIGTTVEEALAADPTFGDTVAGLKLFAAAAVDVESGYVDDETAMARITYEIAATSVLA